MILTANLKIFFSYRFFVRLWAVIPCGEVTNRCHTAVAYSRRILQNYKNMTKEFNHCISTSIQFRNKTERQLSINYFYAQRILSRVQHLEHLHKILSIDVLSSWGKFTLSYPWFKSKNKQPPTKKRRINKQNFKNMKNMSISCPFEHANYSWTWAFVRNESNYPSFRPYIDYTVNTHTHTNRFD